MKVENFKRFSLKMLCCEARAFPVCMAYGYIVSRPFFYSAENAHAYESGHVASGGDCKFALAVNMPPTKVCPQCKAAVPVRWKTCERCDHVFRSKQKAECNLREKVMKSARKAKDKLHKACKRASEIRVRTLHTPVGRNKTECAWQA